MTITRPIRVGVLIYDDVQALDIVGPVDAFKALRIDGSPRHFSRRFHEVFGKTPAVFVEELRLNENANV